MNVPDYVSPIVAYRAWQWDFARSWTSKPPLKSLNGEWWFPERPLSAKCGAPVARRAPTVRNNHNAPQIGCMCGIYAAKSFDQLRWMGYDQRGISGAVNLWGTIVEHKLGWRAQFAYPKIARFVPWKCSILTSGSMVNRIHYSFFEPNDLRESGPSRQTWVARRVGCLHLRGHYRP
jgi:hypothetical protein